MKAYTAQKRITLAFINDKSPVLDVICNDLTNSGIEILFQTENIEDGLSQLSALQTHLTVCIINLDFYDNNIMAQLQQLRSNYPDVKIIIHSDIDTEETVATILSLGIDGYLLTGSNADDFQNAIRAVSHDKKYFSMGVVAIVQKYFSEKEP